MFSSRRGRPRLNRAKRDQGTEEFITKQKLGFTCDPIDYCFKNGLINEVQQRAAFRFKWLHTVRYGLVGTKSVFDRMMPDSHIPTLRAPEWKKEREMEYHRSLAAISKCGTKEIIMDICIFGKWPKAVVNFVLPNNYYNEQSLPEVTQNQINLLQKGLDALCDI